MNLQLILYNCRFCVTDDTQLGMAMVCFGVLWCARKQIYLFYKCAAEDESSDCIFSRHKVIAGGAWGETD